jgi:ubiquinone biosynthesis protein
VTVLEQLETMTREGLTLSPETIAAMGRTEGRKSRWRTLALWIIAAHLHRDSGRRSTAVIAMLS